MKTKQSLIFLTLLLSILNSSQLHALAGGDHITRNVVLKADLDCTSSYRAITVAAHDITIDLNGYTLSGTPDVGGIQVSSYDKLTVKNGSIKGFWLGINAVRSNRLIVSDVIFYEVGAGIAINAGNNARIRDNQFINLRGQAVNIRVSEKGDTANDNEISNNEFYRGITAISICGDHADRNIIADNLIWKNRESAIRLRSSDFNKLYRNRILDIGDLAAISLNNSSYNTINSNSIQDGEHVAISLGKNAIDCLDTGSKRSSKNQILSNRISGFSTAITMGNSTGSPSDVEGNLIEANWLNNADNGVFLNRSTRNNRLRRNNFAGTRSPVIDHGDSNSY